MRPDLIILDADITGVERFLRTRSGGGIVELVIMSWMSVFEGRLRGSRIACHIWRLIVIRVGAGCVAVIIWFGVTNTLGSMGSDGCISLIFDMTVVICLINSGGVRLRIGGTNLARDSMRNGMLRYRMGNHLLLEPLRAFIEE